MFFLNFFTCHIHPTAGYAYIACHDGVLNFQCFAAANSSQTRDGNCRKLLPELNNRHITCNRLQEVAESLLQFRTARKRNIGLHYRMVKKHATKIHSFIVLHQFSPIFKLTHWHAQKQTCNSPKALAENLDTRQTFAILPRNFFKRKQGLLFFVYILGVRKIINEHFDIITISVAVKRIMENDYCYFIQLWRKPVAQFFNHSVGLLVYHLVVNEMRTYNLHRSRKQKDYMWEAP